MEYGIGNHGDGVNYFGLSLITGGYQYYADGMPLLTVAQAYAIDKKMDDGMPQTGNVMAMDVTTFGWAAGGPPAGAGSSDYESNYGDYAASTGGPVTSSGDIGKNMPAGALSCYDGSKGVPEQYSIQINNGSGINCVLSFRFQ